MSHGYDKKAIDEYNDSVRKRIEKASNVLGIPMERFEPKDIKGNKHLLGLFEYETTSKEDKSHTYQEFITQGAKKYAYKDMDGGIHITVAGVPKSRC